MMQFSYKFLNIQELIIYELTIQELTIINDLIKCIFNLISAIKLIFPVRKSKKIQKLVLHCLLVRLYLPNTYFFQCNRLNLSADEECGHYSLCIILK